MRLSRLGIARGSFSVQARSAPVGDAALLPTLTRAAFVLTPVVIDLGPQLPRLSAFVDSVETDGEHSALVLSPVSADAIPPVLRGPIRIQTPGGTVQTATLVVN